MKVFYDEEQRATGLEFFRVDDGAPAALGRLEFGLGIEGLRGRLPG